METMEIVASKIQTEQATKELYKKAFARVASFVGRLGSSFDETKDIFHDALVIYFEKKTQKGFSIHTTEEAYILGIAKHLWIRKYNHLPELVSLDEPEKNITVPADYYPSIENARLLRFLKSAGKKCMDLLRSFYFEQLSIRKLTAKLNYPNEHAASAQKYKCLEKVRSTIQRKSLSYDDFLQ